MDAIPDPSLVAAVIGDVRGPLLTRFGRAVLAFGKRHRQGLADVGLMLFALLDMFLVFPKNAEVYSYVLTGVAVAALVLRRRYPFLVLLICVPGFLAGWSALAGMIALYELAKRRTWCWQTAVGTVMVVLCYFVTWPLDKFLAESWNEQARDLLWGVIHAGAPLALGLLVTTYKELRRRISELATIREREEALQSMAIRTDERTKLAREMHDVVSHQVTLIAMQAGALKVTAQDEASREIAKTIRRLSTRTLEELRQLVGVLRAPTDDECVPDLADLERMVSDSGIPVTLTLEGPLDELPQPVSGAAYRTVQEALTNVGKYAPAAATSVLVQANKRELLVQVRNERPRGQRTPALPSGGHGLVGLTERAELLGGSFHAAPSVDGGFVVTSRFPLGVSTLPAAHAV
ncbi:histidine kinase [Kutzneria viridogrisea]|uniref:histidine kinase n=1 Tax=Kutzneria viridogrisea TaxID=47990 RepID=A0ABR6BNX9_9PSEU|nr:histidine kinase [Kutzneria albida]MBA8928613.1 signal transduction histidine kinase [Kutzneria viridogrisea]